MKASPELRQIITSWFESVTKGDSTWPERHISRRAEVRLVGTDPNEWLSGEEAINFLAEEAKSMGGVVQVSMKDVEAYEEGSVGWGIARPILTLPGGKQIFPRWSAIFHQEEGTWKLVQLHASVGISNEELLGM